MGDAVAAQLVGHETEWLPSLTLQKSPKANAASTPVPTRLHEDVDYIPVLIHRTPEILTLTLNGHEHFVQEPRISKSTLASPQPPSVVRAELRTPLSNGFVRHDDSSFGQ